MKKILLQLMILFAPLVSFSQQNQWTPEQQEQFRKQMEQFKEQLQQQMDQLRDSLALMNEHLKQQDWSGMDSMNFNFDMPEIPPIPEQPEIPDFGNMEYFPGDDSTEVRVGKWKMTVENGYDGNDKVKVYKDEAYCEENDERNEGKNIRTRFLLLDLGLNNYFGNGLSSSLPSRYGALEPNPGKSWVVNLHVFQQRINLIDHHLWLSYGAFFEFNSYKFNSDDVLVPKIDSVAFRSSEVALTKNKLSSEYVGIPVMLRYETNRHDESKSFHIGVGGFGEYLLGAHTKTKTDTGDKTKQHDDFNLSRLRYGITGRIGYGWVNLFVNYSLSELFETGAGPVLTPVSGGLAFEF